MQTLGMLLKEKKLSTIALVVPTMVVVVAFIASMVDPCPAIQCRPGTSVRLNGVPLVTGDLVPNAPFEINVNDQ